MVCFHSKFLSCNMSLWDGCLYCNYKGEYYSVSKSEGNQCHRLDMELYDCVLKILGPVNLYNIVLYISLLFAQYGSSLLSVI